jgi:hypothetical protein
MITKKEITKFAKNIIRSQKGLQNRQLMHPRREWMTGILIAVCIFGASITWSSLQYFEYKNSDQQTIAESEVPVSVYRETLVQEALAAFEKKALKLNMLLGGRVPVLLEEEVVIEPDTEVSDSPEVSEEKNEDTATTTEVSASSSEPEIVSKEPVPEEPEEESSAPAGEGSAQLAPSI